MHAEPIIQIIVLNITFKFNNILIIKQNTNIPRHPNSVEKIFLLFGLIVTIFLAFR